MVFQEDSDAGGSHKTKNTKKFIRIPGGFRDDSRREGFEGFSRRFSGLRRA